MAEPVHRTNVNFLDRQKSSLDFMMEATGHNQTEVLRDSADFYANMGRLAAAGAPLYTKDAEGREIPIVVPGMYEAYTQSLIALVAPDAAKPPTPEQPTS